MRRLFSILLALVGITALVVPTTVGAFSVSYDKGVYAQFGGYYSSLSSSAENNVNHTLGSQSEILVPEESGEIIPLPEEVVIEVPTEKLLSYATSPGEIEVVEKPLPQLPDICVECVVEQPPVGAVPEPNSIALLGLGLAVISLVHFRKM